MKKSYLLLLFNVALFIAHHTSLSMGTDNQDSKSPLTFSEHLTTLQQKQAKINRTLALLEQSNTRGFNLDQQIECALKKVEIKKEALTLQQQIRNLLLSNGIDLENKQVYVTQGNSMDIENMHDLQEKEQIIRALGIKDRFVIRDISELPVSID